MIELKGIRFEMDWGFQLESRWASRLPQTLTGIPWRIHKVDLMEVMRFVEYSAPQKEQMSGLILMYRSHWSGRMLGNQRRSDPELAIPHNLI
jgi:hypothetical protein